MPGEEQLNPRIKVNVDGSEESVSRLRSVIDTLKALGQAVEKDAKGPFQDIWESFKRGREESGQLAGVFNALTTAIKGPLGPLAAAAAVWGAYTEAAVKGAEATVESWKQLRQLQAIAGGTIEDVQGLRNALTLMGVPAESLQIAFFRLGIAVEQNSLSLRRYGIAVRDETGNMKEPIKVFEEIRDKLALINNESERNLALRELFGRQGVRMAAVFKADKAAFDEYLKSGREMAAIDEKIAEDSKELVISQGRLELAQKKYNAAIAEWAGFRIKERFEQIKIGIYGVLTAMIEHDKYLEKRREIGRGVLFGRFLAGFSKEAEEAAEAQFQAERLEKEAKRVQEEKGRAAPFGKEDQKEREKELTREHEMNVIRIKDAAETEGAIEKIKTGMASEVTRKQIDANQQLIEEEQSSYEARLANWRKLFKDQTDEQFMRNKEIVDLTEKHEKKLLELRSQGNKERRKLDEELVKEQEELLQRQLKAFKTVEDMTLAIYAADEKYKLGVLKDNQEQGADLVKGTEQIKEDAIAKRSAATLGTIDVEIAAWQKLKEQYAGNALVARKADEELMQLASKRMKAELDANEKIVEARREMIEKLRGLEREKASIGGTLEQKAEASLAKRGYTSITQGMIQSEASRLMGWAEYYTMVDRWGGGLSPEQRAMTREYSDVAGKMLKINQAPYSAVDIAGNIQKNMDTRSAAFGFGVKPEDWVSDWTGAKSPGQINPATEAVTSKLDELIGAVKQKAVLEIDGQQFGNIVQDTLTRLLEFQAARQ